ncbi:MAG: hypothetical protein AAGH15_00305 [Myxococcota bacterium]
MTRAVLAASALLVGAASLGPPHPPLEDGVFVRAEGPRFHIGDRPFHFVGANVAVMHGADRRAALEETLDAVVADGLSVVRVWAFGEASENDGQAWRRDYAFRLAPDVWVDESYAQLDRVLVEARARGLRVILVLANRWGDYGGFSQLARWAGAAPAERHLDGPELDGFYACSACEALYRAHAQRLLGRTNAISGVRYIEDPTILSWELVNEISAASAAGAAAMVGWVTRQARFVRERAPRQLVGAGHIGYRTLRERAQWRRVQECPFVDYADSHAYPALDARVATLPALRAWIDDREQLARHAVGKPLVWGEVGFADDRARLRGRPRAGWLEAFLRQVHRDGGAGALLWIYAHGRPEEPGSHVVATEDPRHARGVREVLASYAARNAAAPPEPRNARLDAALGATPIFVAKATVRGAPVATRWDERSDALVACLSHEAFRYARAEAAGVADPEGGRAHFWAAGEGRVDFPLRWPEDLDVPPARLVLRARLSSEVPGRGAGPEEGSLVSVEWGGVELGVLEAPPDDGDGQWRELVVSDASTLRALTRLRPRRLRFLARADVGAGGVCLYAPDPGEAAGAVEVRLERGSATLRP